MIATDESANFQWIISFCFSYVSHQFFSVSFKFCFLFLSIYKSHTAVAKLMSFSSAGRSEMITLLLKWLLDSNRTLVTPQNMACSGPLISDLPQTVVAFVS
jgi:hypothetical protein